jgi:ABC-type glycerol-3-phosphate transport system permease component
MEIAKPLPVVRERVTVMAAPRRPGIRVTTILLHMTIIIFCSVILLPLAWVVIMSVKSDVDAYTGHLWPEHFDFTHYSYVFVHIPTVLHNYMNTLIITTSTIILASTCAVLAGYVLAHLRLPGKNILFTVIVASLFFPTRLVSVMGIFEIQSKLGLINTIPGLILPYVTLSLTVSILVMRGIFEQISPEILDAAKIDGASSWRILTVILLPLVINGLVVLIIINFVTAWGEYLLAVTLTNDQSVRTLEVVLATSFGGFGDWTWPRTAAVYVMAITPGIVGFAFVQRWYMKGLLEGALKV